MLAHNAPQHCGVVSLVAWPLLLLPSGLLLLGVFGGVLPWVRLLLDVHGSVSRGSETSLEKMGFEKALIVTEVVEEERSRFFHSYPLGPSYVSV